MMDSTAIRPLGKPMGQMAKIVETNPERFMYQPNVSPIKHKGVQNTIKEMTYWSRRKAPKIFKFYPPEDTLYEAILKYGRSMKKAQELARARYPYRFLLGATGPKSKYACPCSSTMWHAIFRASDHGFSYGYPYK